MNDHDELDEDDDQRRDFADGGSLLLALLALLALFIIALNLAPYVGGK